MKNWALSKMPAELKIEQLLSDEFVLGHQTIE